MILIFLDDTVLDKYIAVWRYITVFSCIGKCICNYFQKLIMIVINIILYV